MVLQAVRRNEILQKLEQIENKEMEQDDKIMIIFEYLKQFEQLRKQELEQKERPKIGYNQSEFNDNH